MLPALSKTLLVFVTALTLLVFGSSSVGTDAGIDEIDGGPAPSRRIPQPKPGRPLPSPPVPGRSPEVVLHPDKSCSVTPWRAGNGFEGVLTIKGKPGPSFDFEALRKALKELRAAYAEPPSLLILAGHGTEWSQMVRVVSLARWSSENPSKDPLFPVVFLGVLSPKAAASEQGKVP